MEKEEENKIYSVFKKRNYPRIEGNNNNLVLIPETVSSLTSKSSILHFIKSYLVKLKPLTELNLLQEQYCNVSPNYTLSYEDASFPETSIRLPDGNMIVMGRETFMAPEIMFQVKIKMRLI